MAKLIFQIPPSTQQRRRIEKTVETERILGPVLTNIPSGLFVLQYMNYVVCGLVGGSFRSAEDTLAKLIPWTQWPLLFFNCLKKNLIWSSSLQEKLRNSNCIIASLLIFLCINQ